MFEDCSINIVVVSDQAKDLRPLYKGLASESIIPLIKVVKGELIDTFRSQNNIEISFILIGIKYHKEFLS